MSNTLRSHPFAAGSRTCHVSLDSRTCGSMRRWRCGAAAARWAHCASQTTSPARLPPTSLTSCCAAQVCAVHAGLWLLLLLLMWCGQGRAAKATWVAQNANAILHLEAAPWAPLLPAGCAAIITNIIMDEAAAAREGRRRQQQQQQQPDSGPSQQDLANNIEGCAGGCLHLRLACMCRSLPGRCSMLCPAAWAAGTPAAACRLAFKVSLCHLATYPPTA